MTRKEATALLGNQPKTALRSQALALQMHTHGNTQEDWQRLMALAVLGYKVGMARMDIQARIDA